MKFHIWRQIRLAGALVNLVGVFTRNFPLLCVGLCLIAVGVVGAINRLEQTVETDNDSKKMD